MTCQDCVYEPWSQRGLVQDWDKEGKYRIKKFRIKEKTHQTSWNGETVNTWEFVFP